MAPLFESASSTDGQSESAVKFHSAISIHRPSSRGAIVARTPMIPRDVEGVINASLHRRSHGPTLNIGLGVSLIPQWPSLLLHAVCDLYSSLTNEYAGAPFEFHSVWSFVTPSWPSN